MFDFLSVIESQALYIMLHQAHAKGRYLRVSFDTCYIALLRTGGVITFQDGDKRQSEYPTLAHFLNVNPLHKCEI